MAPAPAPAPRTPAQTPTPARSQSPAPAPVPALAAAARRRPIGTGTKGPLGDSISLHRLSTGDPIVVRRTARRKTGLAAFWENGQAVIAVPARLSLDDEAYWVPHMAAKLEHSKQREAGLAGRRNVPASDAALLQRSHSLSAQFLGARAVPDSVRWVSNQNGRWGSATPARKTIRISHHVQGMPDWVVDYVLLHELAHLIHPNHSPAFWAELAGYSKLEEAKAFLQGASFASARNIMGMGEGMDDGRDDGTDDGSETSE
ncbi:YgjP-like metallopeptidase domain-containing protein [Specibacter sp. NPDC078709]|uniref:M48 metallopeptidase family protein n=1 Tax=Specibacter sp. NPDC078709 TaxID=3154364 RepID=UPI003449E364